jgi:hypothetical protein
MKETFLTKKNKRSRTTVQAYRFKIDFIEFSVIYRDTLKFTSDTLQKSRSRFFSTALALISTSGKKKKWSIVSKSAEHWCIYCISIRASKTLPTNTTFMFRTQNSLYFTEKSCQSHTLTIIFEV